MKWSGFCRMPFLRQSFTLKFSGLTTFVGGRGIVDWDTRRVDLSAPEIRQTIEWTKKIFEPIVSGNLIGLRYDDALRKSSFGEVLFHDYGHLAQMTPVAGFVVMP